MFLSATQAKNLINSQKQMNTSYLTVMFVYDARHDLTPWLEGD